jgi:hypothetical protein
VLIRQKRITSVTLVLEDPPDVFRQVTVQGSMYIVDDETWAADERAHRDIYMPEIPLTAGDVAHRSQVERLGGEVRVELDLTLRYQPDASVLVNYDARLYEGTSTESADLDDRKTGSVVVARDIGLGVTINLFNAEWDGGDKADIHLRITNARQP